MNSQKRPADLLKLICMYMMRQQFLFFGWGGGIAHVTRSYVHVCD